ncbi:2',3'-cyclic-nucleotide 3'-phosphodiesterase [Neoarius graeffei]|uniref:2',3'-cyclic-nucleotide 3'-phosphodiesterase n=1 Tax=Neoarius graeffei TaxID=443677 RepID=UPI00298CD1DD|nr:2',3'-cyclic-nucleotide 3'-phosphodiesterase [Neoarius graeffei]XP_060757980.1 2',3'-cyclic-nucleotide 3'-phosphodiesterase [Neoarius graeffei]
MDADQNQQVPEDVAQNQVAETELPTPEQPKSEVNETPSAQDPPEPEKTAVEESKPVESTEQTEVEPAKENVSETAKESEKLPEKEEVAEEVPEKAVEVEKSEEPATVEEQPKVDVVEQQTAEPAEPEQKAEPEKDVTAASEPPAVEAAPKEPVSEAEVEKPSEVQAEPLKEVEAKPKEPALPLFYGWFLASEDEEKLKDSPVAFLKTLGALEAFKKHVGDFTGDAGKEVNLEQYFQAPALLHCTTQFCDYGKAEGAKEYAEQQVVKDSCGKATELSVVGLLVTPRVFGARVSLTPEQLPLWPAGADKVGIPPADLPGVEALPVGSRAHVTLGCAANVLAVQTGIDLLEILILQQGEEKEVPEEELELGKLSYLGKGRWYLSLKECITCNATFSSFSEEQRPAEPAKKEGGEKKKKLKCSIL